MNGSWNATAKRVFEEAGLPEVDESQLETGLLSNAQITAMFVGTLAEFKKLVHGVIHMTNPTDKRKILSKAVSMSNDA